MKTTTRLGERVYAWWRRFTGHSTQDAARKATLEAALSRPRQAEASTPPRDELSLAPDQAPARPRTRTGRRGGGFNPYSNDAGLGKTRTWDDVDTRL